MAKKGKDNPISSRNKARSRETYERTQPIKMAAKVKRLIKRLKHFGQEPKKEDMTIKELRKQLHPFVVKPKAKSLNYPQWLQNKWELTNTGKWSI